VDSDIGYNTDELEDIRLGKTSQSQVSSVVKCLPSVLEALGSIPSIPPPPTLQKKKRERKEGKKEEMQKKGNLSGRPPFPEVALTTLNSSAFWSLALPNKGGQTRFTGGSLGLDR
jgi:hypothetical protein